jgi:hypothetical protein
MNPNYFSFLIIDFFYFKRYFVKFDIDENVKNYHCTAPFTKNIKQVCDDFVLLSFEETQIPSHKCFQILHGHKGNTGGAPPLKKV